MQKILSYKFTRFISFFLPIWLFFYFMSVFGFLDDPMRAYIPKELEAQRRIKTVRSTSFPGDGATISVYKLKSKSESFLQNNMSDFQDLEQGIGCSSAMAFLRDIGQGKDKKIWKFIKPSARIYYGKNLMVLPDEGLIITCTASW